MPTVRPGITMSADLHVLATEEAKARGLTLSALIEEALRDKILWQIVSWWKGEEWPYCNIEATGLTPSETGKVFLETQSRLSGTPGLVSVAAIRQGETPRWSPVVVEEMEPEE
jgi:hypothetical protein